MPGAEFHNPEVRLGRRYRFSASHRLHTGLLPAERNREVFGKCNNPHGHGHDYVMEITLAGPVDPGAGRLVPLDLLDHFVKRVWLDQVDRRNLNLDLAEFAAAVPTTENLALAAARRLAQAWPHWFGGRAARLEKVRIWETPRNIFEVLAADAVTQEATRNEIVIESRRQGS